MKRYVYTILACTAIFAGLFWFRHLMLVRAQEWANQGVAIPLSDRVMLGVAALWGRMWWLFMPFIYGIPLFIVALLHALKQQKWGTLASGDR